MKMLMSFWTRSSAILLCFIFQSGCASLDAPYTVTVNTPHDWTTKYDNLTSPDFEKAVYARYCHSGKQVSRFKVNIEAIRQKGPKGMPLDSAGGLLGEYIGAEKFLVSSALISMTTNCDPNQANECRNYGSNLFLKSDKKFDEEVDYAKSIRLNVHPNAGNREVLPIFLFTDYKHPILFFFEEVDEFPGMFQYAGCSNKCSHHGPKENQSAKLIELLALRNGYTMMIPENVQASMPIKLAGELKTFASKYLNNGEYFGPLNEGVIDRLFGSRMGYAHGADRMTASKALLDQKYTWMKYLIAYTSVKTAPSKDPRIVNYELNLDLGPFCKYARGDGDLTSD